MDNEPSRRDDSVSIRGQVLTLLRDRGPMPRIALARQSGLSPTSITRLIAQFIDEGLVSEGDTISPARLGRPATEVALRRDSFFVVGVQIGVGFVSIGVFDIGGTVLESSTLTFPADASVEMVLTTAAREIERLIESTPGVDRNRMLGIGVAAPGPVDPAGRLVMLPVNLTWRDAPVADILEQELQLPVRVEHNVRSMALAEATFGAGRELGSVAFVYLRTGLGAGLVVEGEPFSGGVHGAIEIGHLRTSARNRPCVCGGRGCLETLVSDTALRTQCATLGVEVGNEGPLAALWTAGAHAEAASSGRANPAEVAAAIDEVVEQLATGLSSLATLLNPQVIFVGGTLGDMPDEFIQRLSDESRRSIFPLLRDTIRLERSSLGLNAGMLGAATAALDKLFYA
jgi:predicted NBD/HSP70 family sugar kinase